VGQSILTPCVGVDAVGGPFASAEWRPQLHKCGDDRVTRSTSPLPWASMHRARLVSCQAVPSTNSVLVTSAQ